MAITRTGAFEGPLFLSGLAPIPFDDFHALSTDEVVLELDGALVPASDYTIVLNGDGSGTITPLVSLIGTAYIYSRPHFQQKAHFERYAPFYPDQLNEQLDRAAGRDIYLNHFVERSIRVPPGELGSELPAAADRINRLITFGDPDARATMIPVRDVLEEIGITFADDGAWAVDATVISDGVWG